MNRRLALAGILLLSGCATRRFEVSEPSPQPTYVVTVGHAARAAQGSAIPAGASVRVVAPMVCDVACENALLTLTKQLGAAGHEVRRDQADVDLVFDRLRVAMDGTPGSTALAFSQRSEPAGPGPLMVDPAVTATCTAKLSGEAAPGTVTVSARAVDASGATLVTWEDVGSRAGQVDLAYQPTLIEPPLIDPITGRYRGPKPAMNAGQTTGLALTVLGGTAVAFTPAYVALGRGWNRGTRDLGYGIEVGAVVMAAGIAIGVVGNNRMRKAPPVPRPPELAVRWQSPEEVLCVGEPAARQRSGADADLPELEWIERSMQALVDRLGGTP